MSRIFKQVQVAAEPVVINNLYLVTPPAVAPVAESAPPVVPDDDPRDGAAEQAKLIIESAQAEAAAYLEQARLQMEDECRKRYEDNRQAGYEAGFSQGKDEGYKAGFEQGRKSALEQLEDKIRSAAQKADNMLDVAAKQSKAAILDAEQQILEIAVAIAQRILNYELDTNSEAVVSVVKAAMAKVYNQEQVTIRVNPHDFDTVMLSKPELEAILQREQSISLVADQTVSRGGCLIDSQFGTVDARLENQLESLRKVLQEARS